MKNILLLVLLASCTLISCKSAEEKAKEQAEIDDKLILDYAKENNLTLEAHSSGLYFMIEKEGTGTSHPNLNSKVTIHYRGTLLDGSEFDSSLGGDPRTFALRNLIEGWQIGIPLMVRNEKRKLIIPSRLGYGSRETDKIPSYSVLVFDIELQGFQ